MHLFGIRAADYGALSDVTLDGLGPGLNVVFGKNEAGKTTLTTLTRHVLYGFPTKGAEAQQYVTPHQAARAGSLTFADDGRAWRVERVDARKVADREASIVPLDGAPARPGLVEQLTAGTNAQMFRAVFGFGIKELADFGQLDDEALRSRLYTAGAGLGVSALHDVRDMLAKEASTLYALRTGKARINDLAKALADKRAELREFEALAAGSAEQRRRLDELAAELKEADEAQRSTATRGESLARLDAEAFALEKRVAETEAAAERARARAEELRRRADAVGVDEAALGRAETIESLSAGLQAFELSVENLAAAEAAERRAADELDEAVRRVGSGYDATSVAGLATGAALEDEVEAHERKLAETHGAAELERRRAEDAADAAERAGERVAPVLREAEIEPGAKAASTIAERSAVIDRVLSHRVAAVPATLPAAVAALGFGVLLVGVLLHQLPVALAGAGLLALGAFLLFRRAQPGVRDQAGLAAALGRKTMPPDAELLRLRNGLAEAAKALETVAAAEERSQEAAAAAARLRAEYDGARLAWRDWLNDHKLAGEPETVARLLRAAAEAQRSMRRLEAARRETAELRDTVGVFVGRVIAAGFAAQDAGQQDAALAVRQAQTALKVARAADLERATALRDAEAGAAEVQRLDAECERLTAKREELVEAGSALLGQAGLAGVESVEGLRVAARLASEAAEAARRGYQELLGERERLAAVLREAERQTRGAELRQEEASLHADLLEALDRFAVVGVAAALLAEAQQKYEAERQPAMVQRAAELFRDFTGGRYVSLTASLTRPGGLSAVLAEGGVRTPEQLSQGTQEQLYLALRLAFISELGETGRSLPILMDDIMVDFDDERKVRVAETIAGVARERQVILFTCHDATRELFSQVAPGHVRVTLER